MRGLANISAMRRFVWSSGPTRRLAASLSLTCAFACGMPDPHGLLNSWLCQKGGRRA